MQRPRSGPLQAGSTQPDAGMLRRLQGQTPNDAACSKNPLLLQAAQNHIKIHKNLNKNGIFRHPPGICSAPEARQAV